MPKAVEPFGTVHDRSVYLPAVETLVAADLHLGRAAASAVDAPLNEGPGIVDRVLSLVDRYEPTDVVLAGDVLDAFGHVPREARETLDALRTGLAAADTQLRALRGNHDAQLPALGEDVTESAWELPDGTVVCHGHERPRVAGSRFVIGHDHPAIDIEGQRRPCYLYGPGAYEGADVLALPAFNPATPGTAINDWDVGDPLSPLLAEIPRFHPVVWDADTDRALVFPSLEALQPYL